MLKSRKKRSRKKSKKKSRRIVKDGGKKRSLELETSLEEDKPKNKKIKIERKTSSEEDTVMKSVPLEEDDIVIEDTFSLTKLISNLFTPSSEHIQQNKKYEKKEDNLKKNKK